MSKFRYFLFLVPAIVSFAFVASVAAQNNENAKSLEILESLDCPLKLTPDNNSQLPQNLTGVRITNRGTSAIKAWVVYSKLGDSGKALLSIFGTAEIASQPRGMVITKPSENQIPEVFVDYVLFADGSSWGDDTLRMSTAVADFLRGQNLAIERLKNLVDGEDSEWLTLVNRSRSASFDEPIANGKSTRPSQHSFYRQGYDLVLNVLRRAPEHNEFGRELARKLEELEFPVIKTP